MEDGEKMVGFFDVRRYGLDSRLEMGVNKCRILLNDTLMGGTLRQQILLCLWVLGMR